MAKDNAPSIAAGRREFKMHKRLLWDVITRQAGTIEKSVLEAVMNSVDAGSTSVDISIDANRFVISDDGHGFAGAEQVEKFFETFGQPHQEGDATYGRYRMGRGQLFCFGVNTWLSNEFKMVVDMKPQEKTFNADEGMGLGYDLSIMAKRSPGCCVTVDLYDKLLPSALNRVRQEIETYVKYAQVPVFLNGQQINKIPGQEKWKLETEDAYFNLSERGDLKVYNLGVLVRSYYAGSLHGLGGTVVSKKRLDVNFARNDVVSTCKVWKGIQKTLKSEAGHERRHKAKLTDADRQAIADDVLGGELTLSGILEAKVVTDVVGTHHPISRLASLHNWSGKVTAAPRNDRKGDRAMQARLTFVLDQSTLDRFNVPSTKALFDALAGAMRGAKNDMPKSWEGNVAIRGIEAAVHIDRGDLDAFYTNEHESVSYKDLNKYERVALKALQNCADAVWYAHNVRNGWKNPDPGVYGRRRIVQVGESDTAHGWTDGRGYIWVNRDLLGLLKKGTPGWSKLTGLVIHEYNHGAPDTDTHVHDAEFYRAIHDQILDNEVMGRGVDAIQTTLYKAAKEANKTGAKHFHEADRAVVMREAGIDVAELDAQDEDAAEVPRDMAACSR